MTTITRVLECPSCGHSLEERFCPRCGERRLDEQRYSLRHFLAESVEALVNTDGRLWRTLSTLVTRPGVLTSEYFAGRRTPYLRPLQLFLLCNVFFFVVQGLSGNTVLNTPLRVHAHHTRHRELAHRWAYGAPHVEGEPLTIARERFQQRFDQAADAQSRSLVIIMVPLFAVLLGGLFYRRRRYFAEHLVFATHFYAFMLLASPVMAFVMLQLFRFLISSGVPQAYFNDTLLTLPIVAVWCWYLAAAVRRSYEPSRWGSLWRGVVLGFSVLPVLFLYRFILFFVAFYSA
jgi:hypothetical protein